MTFDDTGAASSVVNITNTPIGFLSASSFTINPSAAHVYNFAGSGGFAGPGQMWYTGAGFVSMANVNLHTGGTVISNSAAYLDIKNYGALGAGPLTLAMAGGSLEVEVSGSASVGIAGNVNVQDDFTLQFDGTGSFAGVFLGNLAGTSGKKLIIKPASAALSAVTRYRLYGSSTVMNADIEVDGNSSAAANYDATVLAPYHATGTQIYNGAISGTCGLVQRGNGTTILSGANTYSGGTIPTAGAIGLGSDDNGSVGSLGSGSLLLAPELPNLTGSGQIFAYGGARTIANSIQYPSGTNNLTLIIGGTNNLNLSGAFSLQGNDGVQTNSITARLLQVTNTAATIISGIIADNSLGYGITKTGTGSLYLDAANTYSGLTTISQGVLAGSGSLNGSVLVTTNGQIGGGDYTGIGSLTVNGNLTLTNGGGFFRVNRSGSSSDRVSVTGNLTNFGTGVITITNVGGTLQVGDTFTLFNKAMVGGGSLSISGGGTGVAWTNYLAVNGTIQVIPSVNTNPTNITAVVSGSTLTLSWPADHTGWR
ncbi:MAG TPA: autotransporter-associated beta strand repeat-containing protein, partial [Verrucomicrobiae bacterium]